MQGVLRKQKLFAGSGTQAVTFSARSTLIRLAPAMAVLGLGLIHRKRGLATQPAVLARCLNTVLQSTWLKDAILTLLQSCRNNKLSKV